MRNFFKKVAAMIRSLRASMSEVVLTAVRGVDGVINWTWDVVTRSAVGGPAGFEADAPEPEIPEPATSAELDDEMVRDAGDMAVRVAKALVRGQEPPAGSEPVIVRWLANLDRDSLWQVAAADPLLVGRHVLKRDAIKSPEGFVVRHPEPEADMERDRKRRRLVEERREVELAGRARLRREHAERMEAEAEARTPNWSSALSLSPVLSR